MRSLTADELRAVFKKLSLYIGRNIEHLLSGGSVPYSFVLHNNRVFHAPERIVNIANSLPKSSLMSLGVCFGKFSKKGNFKLHITALDAISKYSKNKVWLKQSSEMSFLYGNNVLKSGLSKITDSVDKYQGVVVMSVKDVPLGFGVAGRTTAECKDADPQSNIVLHQGDVGEYLRTEDEIS